MYAVYALQLFTEEMKLQLHFKLYHFQDHCSADKVTHATVSLNGPITFFIYAQYYPLNLHSALYCYKSDQGLHVYHIST